MNPQNSTSTDSNDALNEEVTVSSQEQLSQQATEAAKHIITAPENTIQPDSLQVQPATPQNIQPSTSGTQSTQIVTPLTIPAAEQAQSPQLPPEINTPQSSAVPQADATTPEAASPQTTKFSTASQIGGGMPPVVMGSIDNPIVLPSQPGQKHSITNGKKRKVIIVSAVSATILAGAVSAFMFLWFIPNQPNNVWSTGLSRTGKQLDALLETLQDEESIKKLEKSVFTVKGTLTMDAQNYSLDIDSKYDPKNSASTIKIAGNDSQAENNFAIDTEVRTQFVTDAVLPNIYFRLSGFDSLGIDTMFPVFAQYDNKWIAVEQDYLKILSDGTAPVNGQENLTEKDVTTIVADVNTVSKEYVFTNDATKAVIQQTQFIGTEESEGITANHYKAKINAANARTYCSSLVDKLSQNAAVKKIVNLPEQEFIAEVQKQKDECDKTTIDESEFDIWIDKKIKILHKVRLYEDLEKAKKEAEAEKAKCEADMSEYSDLMVSDGGASFCSYYNNKIETGERYTEFGQVFKNKDSLLLFAGSKSATNKETSNARADVTINVKDLTAEGIIKANAEGDNKYTLDVSLATKPFEGTVEASKPEGAIPLQQVLDSIGLGSEMQ